jgi:ABC-type lipoprotein export system ATPase subunit
MQITNLEINNFKAIKTAHLKNLGSLVVIAGQNGSGKSAILDAIRLLKSVYGGYQTDDFQQWLGEMKIDFNSPKSVMSIFNDKELPLTLRMTVKLHQEEKAYLKTNAESLMSLSRYSMGGAAIGDMRQLFISSTTRRIRKNFEIHERALKSALLSELKKKHLTAELTINPNSTSTPEVKLSLALGALFTNFVPQSLGVIDFHGPHRLYAREQLDSINVNLRNLEDQRRNTLLYNANSKYANIKNELAADRLRELLSEAAGAPKLERDLITTLQDLFATFFPSKTFLGPRPTPDGKLTFPVRVGDSIEHDLDELSAGEKEILYGYLRLRSSAPKHSIVLIDEPELHLNPKLISKLPDFYYRNLAKNLSNQVWLVTHADALLRDVLGRPEYSVFHMKTPPVVRGTEQALPIIIKQDLDAAIVDLVGNLAGYSPDSKLLIFEGDPIAEFDLRMTTELFPDFPAKVNCVSGTNKSRVRGLYQLLTHLHKKQAITTQIFAITDRDSEDVPSDGPTEFSWDCYHIENYLLNDQIIASVVNDISGGKKITAAQVERDLRRCASELMPSLVQGSIGHELNQKLVSSINTKISPHSKSVARDLVKVVAASTLRIAKLVAEEFTESDIQSMMKSKTYAYEADLKNGNWRKSMRGRDILHQFTQLHLNGRSNYQTFRNLLLARMRDEKLQPPGMKKVLDQILRA